MFSKLRKNNRRGFTLVELLVVMAIVSILMGLVMPAVMQIRVNALRARCTNNQKNIGTALIAYDATKQYLPYSYTDNGSWAVQILEQLGEGKLADNFISNESIAIPLAVMKCPAGDAERTGLSYGVNCGWGNNTSMKDKTLTVRLAAGIFLDKASLDKAKSSIKSIKDGAANTILLSESLKKMKNDNHWMIGVNWYDGNNPRVGLTWNASSDNSANKDALRREGNFFDSQHPNVCIVTFADSSVRQINKTINYMTYKCLMAPDDVKCASNLKMEDDPNLEF